MRKSGGVNIVRKNGGVNIVRKWSQHSEDRGVNIVRKGEST